MIDFTIRILTRHLVASIAPYLKLHIWLSREDQAAPILLASVTETRQGNRSHFWTPD